MGGDVIDDGIEHEPEWGFETGGVGPCPQGGIDLFVIDYGKAVVGGVGVEGEQMDGVDEAG